MTRNYISRPRYSRHTLTGFSPSSKANVTAKAKIQKKKQTKPKSKNAKKSKKPKAPKDRGPLVTTYMPIMNAKIQARRTGPFKIELDVDEDGKETY